MEEIIMAYPEWVEKQRRPGTNINCIRGKYYLYEVSSRWDKEKKRSIKKTGKYLGRITEAGLIPPRKSQIKNHETDIENVSNKGIIVKEYGASSVLCSLGSDIFSKLKKIFPEEAEEIFTLAALKIIEQCPFKRMEFLYEKSYLSDKFGKLPLSKASISGFLKRLGEKREQIKMFMNEFISDTEYILFDGTNIITKSEKLDINRVGYNSHRQYDPQINLLYAFSTDTNAPAYYRIVSGNVREVSSFKLAVEDSGIKNMVVIADKGFGSKANFEMLEQNNLKYIVPLRRSSSLFKKDILKSGDRNKFDGYFLFNKRVIWFYEYKIDNQRLIVFLDSDLKNDEEKDYLQRLEANYENYSQQGFFDKQYDFGTIVMQTNLNDAPQKIYELYKSRGQIEQSFDFLKNFLDADKIYLQNKYAVEAWAFINHISLLMTYIIYSKLKNKNLLSNFSVSDFISHLKYIHRLKCNDSFSVSEISSKTSVLLNSLDIHIT